ncbi:hypothetical protein Salat_2130300 [Sesamum alatum]|uniref:CCHC-type domain-containing protein n=1 Tax=Sesamum alatum TaxID=300844 RepID=A0AAE1Y202_9LAMI|nr:hypothetical protein Salat_2130300 [Sesamum alatum]
MKIEVGLVELNQLEERVKRARPTPPTVQGTRFGKVPNVRRTPPRTLPGNHNVSQQNRCPSNKESDGNCKFCGHTGHAVNSCWRRGGANKPIGTGNQAGRPKIHARAFTLGGEEVTDPTTVIEGTIRISNTLGRVLFDPGATYSFVASHFTHYLTVKAEGLPYTFEVIHPNWLNYKQELAVNFIVSATNQLY